MSENQQLKEIQLQLASITQTLVQLKNQIESLKERVDKQLNSPAKTKRVKPCWKKAAAMYGDLRQKLPSNPPPTYAQIHAKGLSLKRAGKHQFADLPDKLSTFMHYLGEWKSTGQSLP